MLKLPADPVASITLLDVTWDAWHRLVFVEDGLREGRAGLKPRPCVPQSLEVNSRLQIDPQICHGKPVIRGTRVLVSTILGALSAGDSIETVLEDYPSISAEDIAAALEFASRLSEYQTSAYEVMA